MRNLIINKKTAILLFTLITLGIGYAYFLILSNDPRMSDGGLSFEEADIWESTIVMIGVLSVFLILGSSIHHSWSMGRKFLAITMIIAWPISILYALLLQIHTAWKHNEQNH